MVFKLLRSLRHHSTLPATPHRSWVLRSLLIIALTPQLASSQEFVRGDTNGDASIQIIDAIHSLSFLFFQGVSTPCLDAHDIDDNGSLSILDPILLLQYLFLGGNTPAAPFPSCGSDPTADLLDCAMPPSNCDVGALAIDLEQGLTSVELMVGEVQFVAFVPTLSGAGGILRDVTFTQTVDPDNGGLVLDSDYPFGGWTTSVDSAFLVNESITAITPGTYTITNTATIGGTGETAITMLEVIVTAAGSDTIVLERPGFDPGALPTNSTTPVTFTCLTSGAATPPASVTLDRVDAGGVFQETLGLLLDDGVAPDLVAGDRVFTGSFDLTTGSEGFFYFQATSGAEVSPISDLLATTLPIGVPADDPGQFISDGLGGLVVADQILCKAVDPSDSAAISAAVATIGGTVEGTVPALCLVVVGIPSDGTLQNVIDLAATLASHPAIEFAEPNFVAEEDAFTPNDPSFGVQSNLTVVRADEAWVVARGTVLIAVVDTGVDYSHPDLNAKVILGKDFVDDDDDPTDAGTHGTHVAGIAAADSNNGIGVAGASWGSKILAIRGMGSHAAFSAAVRYAADNGAKVINFSGSGPSSTTTMHNAVKYAVGKGCLFVCTAGNTGVNAARFPASYPESFCVGNSTDADGRAGSSTFGSHIDICAPGVSVTSTVPGGGLGVKSGTSMSAPLVSGCAAVLWSMHPTWTAAQVRTRLLKTAVQSTASLDIGPRIDLFEAIFNGSFEIGDLAEWTATGTASSLTALGPFTPQHRMRMGYASTGPAGDQVGATLKKCFTVQPGVTSFPISFEYNFVTEEYPEFVGTAFDDFVTITITPPGGSPVTLAMESVNASTFSAIGGIDFPGGDNTTGQTGWKTGTGTVPVTMGPGEYLIEISDTGDDIYDSVVLIDNVRLK